MIASLKSYLQANAIPGLTLPPAATEIPSIEWAGPFGPQSSPPTTLPNGVIYPVTDSRIHIPLFAQDYAASLPSYATPNGFPCFVGLRDYTCKGIARQVGTVQVLRLQTDAPVLELTGAVPDGNGTVQTLIVDGKLVPPKVLSCSRGYNGGFNVGTIRIDFGSRQVRDIWLESYCSFAYIKLDQGDTLFDFDDSGDPQITAVGDSYLGVHSDVFGNGGAIALGLAARLGIRKVATDAIGGTGYYNSGGDLGNLNDRLPATSKDGSTIYLIMAGINDYADATGGTLVWPANAVWEQSVTGYLQGLRAAQPNALLIVCARFCPIPPDSDSTLIANTTTNPTGIGDNLYMSALFKRATQALTPPWVFIDVLMGTGWINSSGATGDVTDLQWFTGGTPGPGTSATYKPGNTNGGGGGGFGGIASVPVVTPGQYTQGPEVTVSGGSGTGLMLWASVDLAGNLTGINVQTPGTGYTAGAGLPTISIDPTYQISPSTLGEPILLTGINPNGEYPLPSFAPPGVPASALNNIYVMLSEDTIHPSPLGAEYLAQKLAQSIYDAIMAL